MMVEVREGLLLTTLVLGRRSEMQPLGRRIGKVPRSTRGGGTGDVAVSG